MNRFTGVLLLLALLVSGCATEMKPGASGIPPKQEESGGKNGGGY